MSPRNIVLLAPKKRALISTVIGCLAALLVVAAPAAADSIVYAKDGNVWLANPDGSGQYQVTADGSAAHPYVSPSQADDGTIAAGFGNVIVRLRQNGEALNTIDPPAMLDSASDPVDGPPIDVAISPDGARIAYTMADYACPVGVACDSRTVTAYTAADHLTPPGAAGTTYLHDPSWATASRTLQFGGFTHQVNVQDVSQPTDVHWFDDADVVGQADATDLGDGELNPQGTMLALVRGYGDSASVAWYDVGGDALHGLPPAPAMRCATGADPGIEGPSWSPDGSALAIADAEGIWVKHDAASCDAPQPALAIPGGSHPDWGPAAINPAPRAAPAAPAAVPAAKHGGAAKHGATAKRCGKGSKARRARCRAAAKRAEAIARCKRGKHSAARARCIRAANKGGRG